MTGSKSLFMGLGRPAKSASSGVARVGPNPALLRSTRSLQDKVEYYSFTGTLPGYGNGTVSLITKVSGILPVTLRCCGGLQYAKLEEAPSSGIRGPPTSILEREDKENGVLSTFYVGNLPVDHLVRRSGNVSKVKD